MTKSRDGKAPIPLLGANRAQTFRARRPRARSHRSQIARAASGGIVDSGRRRRRPGPGSDAAARRRTPTLPARVDLAGPLRRSRPVRGSPQRIMRRDRRVSRHRVHVHRLRGQPPRRTSVLARRRAFARRRDGHAAAATRHHDTGGVDCALARRAVAGERVDATAHALRAQRGRPPHHARRTTDRGHRRRGVALAGPHDRPDVVLLRRR